MKRLPIVHYKSNTGAIIIYDVPFIYMTASNDCWSAVTEMMSKFLGSAATDDLGEDKKTSGARVWEWKNHLTGNGFTPYIETENVLTIDALYFVLKEYGPIIACIRKDVNVLHAIVIVGIFRHRVFYLDPDEKFSERLADFRQGQNILVTNGAPDYSEWKKHKTESEARLKAKQQREETLASRAGSPLHSPPMPRDSVANSNFRSRGGPGAQTVANSPSGSPEVGRRSGLLSFGAPVSIHSSQTPETGSEGDLFALRLQLTKAPMFNDNAKEDALKRQYLNEMQKKHSPSRKEPSFSDFKELLAEGTDFWIKRPL